MRGLSLRFGCSALFGAIVACSAWAGPAEDAQRAYDAGDYTLALGLYEQALDASPALAGDARFVADMGRAEARVAYDVGSRLHGEGEYAAAAEQFLLAIAKDDSFRLAFAALDDAQRAAVRQALRRAVDAADAGDLLTAKQVLERSRVHGGGADAQVTAALASILEPSEQFDEAVLQRLEAARELGNDLQWGLALRQLDALIDAQPLLLPARAERARAARMRSMSVGLADEAAALIQQKRLSPAREKLAGAVAVWPYNNRAAELLETIEAEVKRADEAVARAESLLADERWRAAYDQVSAALAIDPSHAEARSVRSTVRVGLVEQLRIEMRVALNKEDYTLARSLVDHADSVWPNSRWTRDAYAEYHARLGQAADQADNTGEAYLRFVLASRLGADSATLHRMERSLIADTQATFTLGYEPSAPAIGVGSDQLASALRFEIQRRFDGPAPVAVVPHHRAEDDAQPGDLDPAPPHYAVRIDITDTDIELRQRESRNQGVVGTAFGQTARSGIGGYNYWEKYGTVTARVRIIDPATDQAIKTWTAHRWANYTDRQQYVVGQSWNTSFWTLPTDEAIASRLARDLAADLWPDIREAVTLARARALRDEAGTLEADDRDAALTRRVQAVILAGQINPREARRELRRMADEMDERSPTGAGIAAE